MNMLTPIELIQRVIDGMAARKFGRIVNITSLSVKMPMAGLDLSSGARAGLTAFLAGVAREVADKNVTINSLLPGNFDTARLHAGLAAAAKDRGVPESTIEQEWRRAIPARRFGQVSELGQTCRVSLQRTRGLHHGSEHRHGRGRVSRCILRCAMNESDEARRLLEAQRAAVQAEGFVEPEVRRGRLERAIDLLVTHQRAICEAHSHDFGQRPETLTRFVDILPSLSSLKYARRGVRRWMRPRRKRIGLPAGAPGVRAQIVHQRWA